jgi:hypothetical protein
MERIFRLSRKDLEAIALEFETKKNLKPRNLGSVRFNVSMM